MASRKRDAYTVALENIHTQYKAFGEKLDLSVDLLRGEVGQLRDEMRAGFRDVRADLVRLETKVDTKVDEPQVEAIVGRMLARAGR